MDITIDVEDYKLNVRAAGILIHNDKLLVHKDLNKEHYALIGGRVEIGENSEDTIKREILEEMGKEIEITGYVSTIENFFELNSKKFHEIMFVHKSGGVKSRCIPFVEENISDKCVCCGKPAKHMVVWGRQY